MPLKFRVWDKESHRMIPPKYLYSIDLLEEQVTERTKCNYTFSLHSIPFDRVDIMQSTGVFDKNGQEIFEGDIVKRYPSPCFKTDWNCKVETVISGDASLLLGEKLGNGIATMPFGTPFSKGNLLEVIGNIYESGELVQWK